MVRVRMLVSEASARWERQPGDIVALPEPLAAEYVRSGRAEYVDAPPEPRPEAAMRTLPESPRRPRAHLV